MGRDMTAAIPDDQPDEMSLEAAKEELHRLLQDNRFRASDRQREILIYLAERRFAGLRENVKAYSIALDVLGRPAGFDASIDPIVRIEISRLRTALVTYYSVFGAELGVTIDIPKGSYVTVFLASSIDTDNCKHVAHILEHDDVGAERMEISGERGSRHRWKMRAVMIAAAGAVVAAAGWKIIERPSFTSKPTLTIAMSAASPELQGDATVTRDTLMTALSQFDSVIVATSVYNNGNDGRRYDLELKYYGDGDDRSVWWQLIDPSSGNLLKSGLEKVRLEGKAPAVVRLELAGVVARKIASPGGVVNTIEMRDTPSDALGNICVARAEMMLSAGAEQGRDGVIRCLERTLAIAAGNADVLATLAKVYAQAPETAGKSLDLARTAVTSAPLSDRAHSALMAARFANGRVDAAIDAGNRALALNPNDSGTTATLGLILFSAGYWKAASNLAQEALAMEDAPPRNASLVLALDAYRTEKWSESSLYAEQALGSDMLTRSVRAAALAKLGSDSAKQRLQDARQGRADYEVAFRKAASFARLRPEMVNALERGLSKIGANFDTVASISRP